MIRKRIPLYPLFVWYIVGMFGLLLAGLSAGFGEVSDSIGKKEVHERVASYYTFGFLNLLFATIFIIAAGLLRNDFIFSLASLPTFIPRLFLEVVQAHISVLAIMKADRGDFGIIRILTVPLLLTVDISLGYHVTSFQMLGIVLISGTVMFLSYAERFKTKGLWLILASAVNAVITISLYKYDITHFNSVEAEQGIVSLVLLLYFFMLAVYVRRENPLRFLLKPAFVVQTAASGLSYAAASFAILFAPASIITGALRAFAVLFSIISGRFYFREKGFLLKVTSFCVIALGLACLALS